MALQMYRNSNFVFAKETPSKVGFSVLPKSARSAQRVENKLSKISSSGVCYKSLGAAGDDVRFN